MKARNERETLQAYQRDRAEKDALIFRQLEERQALQREIKTQRAASCFELMRLRADVAQYRTTEREDCEEQRERVRDRRRAERESQRQTRERRNRQWRDFEP